ncbi:MAG: GNAT family N-acetyltransferase [Candidatus Spechtbacterales bacterium]
MEKNFLTRKAIAKDLEDILKLNFALFKKEQVEYDESLSLEWTYSEGRKYLSDRIDGDDGFVEVAVAQDDVIGYLCGGIAKRALYRVEGSYAELENMFVEESFRGKGVGKKLVEDFIGWCKEQSVGHLSVTAYARNEQALGIYRKAGFADCTVTLEKEL